MKKMKIKHRLKLTIQKIVVYKVNQLGTVQKLSFKIID